MRVEISYIHKEDKIEKVLLAYSIKETGCVILFTTDDIKRSIDRRQYNTDTLFNFYYYSSYGNKFHITGLLVWEGKLVVKRYVEKPDVVMEGYSDDQSGDVLIGGEKNV